jgi:hypothetical protein
VHFINTNVKGDQNIRDSGPLTGLQPTGIMEDLALFSLPVELILNILSFIDWRTLLVCRQVRLDKRVFL